MNNFRDYAAACPHRIDVPLVRRPGNALNIEIGKPLDRCRLRQPEHWPSGTAGRWLASGGSPLVFEPCSLRECPNDPRQARLRRLQSAVEASLADGDILHIEAAPVVEKRTARVIAPGFSGTVGPVVGEGFGAFSYGRWPIDERFLRSGEAARWIARYVGADRAGALQAALNKAHADEIAEYEERREQERSRREGEARLVRTGERLRGAYGHKPGITGPIFGPSGIGR